MCEQPDRTLHRQRGVIGPFRGDGIVVIDNRQDARAHRDLIAGESLRVAFTIPALVVAQDQRGDRIGKRDAGDDFRSHLRVDADLLEFFLRERARLRQNVLGHGQLADIVQQRGGLDPLDLRVGEADRLRQPGGEHLHAPDVHVRGLILGVDGAGERLDRGKVEIGSLLHVALLVLHPPQIDVVGAVGQIQRHEGDRRQPVAGVIDERDAEGRRRGADEVAGRDPPEVVVPDRGHAFVRRQGNRDRHQARVHQVRGRGRADERAGNGTQRHVGGVASQPGEHQAGALDGDDQRGDAEQGPVERVGIFSVLGALAQRAAGGDQHRLVRTEQQQRGEIDRVRDGHRRLARGQRQVDLQRRRCRRQHQQRGEQQRLLELHLRQAHGEQRDSGQNHRRDVQACGDGQSAHQ